MDTKRLFDIMNAIGRLTISLTMVLLLGGCAAFSNDPRVRTPGTMFDDGVIESVVKRDIRKSDPGFANAHLIVVSYNGTVLLAGQVASRELKQKAQEVAQRVAKVRRIHNELEIGGSISYLARSNDTWLTGKVKSKLLANSRTDANKLKVVTENGTVYLMGILRHAEADSVVDVTSQVYGVRQIVKVFEYLD